MTFRTGCSTGFRVVLVDDAEDLLDLLPGRVGERPAGERLGDGIEVVDAAVRVGGDDAVADGREGDLEPVTLVAQRPLGGGVAIRRGSIAHLANPPVPTGQARGRSRPQSTPVAPPRVSSCREEAASSPWPGRAFDKGYIIQR